MFSSLSLPLLLTLSLTLFPLDMYSNSHVFSPSTIWYAIYPPKLWVCVCVFEAFNVCTKAHLKNKHFSWCKWCLLPSITLEPIQQQHDLRTLATTTKNRRIKPVIILGRSYNRDEECLRVYRPCAVCSNRNEINFLNEFPV